MILFLAGVGLLWAEDKKPEILRGVVVAVTDGDTLKLDDSGAKAVTIRLYGLDAPEMDQPHGPEAKAALAELTLGQKVAVEVRGRDRYRRVVGIVRTGGKDVGREMSENGWMWVDYRYCRPSKICRGYWASARRAQKARRGLWANWAHNPREWR